MPIDYQNIGLAGSQSDSFFTIELFAGDTPLPVTAVGQLGEALATAGIAAWTPVHVDAATEAVSLAESGETEPNAITVVEVAEGSPTDVRVPVYKAGTFNIKALNWPASYDTDAKKFAAFAGATDAQIYVRTPYYG